MAATAAMYGADPAQLDQLGEALRHAAEQLDRLRGSLGGRLHHTSWCGTDASRARDEWDHRYTGVLLSVAGALREQGHRLHTEAEQQRRASDVTGGSSAGPHHGGGGLLERLEKVYQTTMNTLGAVHWIASLGDSIIQHPEKIRALGKKLLERFPKYDDLAGAVNKLDTVLDRFPQVDGATKVLDKIGKGLGVVQIVHGAATGDWGEVAFGAIGLGLKANPVGLAISGVMVIDSLTGDHLKDAAGAGLRWTWNHAAPVIADAVTEKFAGDLRAIGNGVNALGTGLSKMGDAAHTAGGAINHAADTFSKMFGKH